MELIKKLINWVTGNDSEESVTLVEEQPAPIKDIGEPVISFVKLVNSNPERFRARSFIDFTVSGNMVWKETIEDTLTGELFWYSKEIIGNLRFGDNSTTLYNYSGHPSFLTQDEWVYVESELKMNYELVLTRLKAIKEARVKRLKKEARQRLVDIYCRS